MTRHYYMPNPTPCENLQAIMASDRSDMGAAGGAGLAPFDEGIAMELTNEEAAEVAAECITAIEWQASLVASPKTTTSGHRT